MKNVLDEIKGRKINSIDFDASNTVIRIQGGYVVTISNDTRIVLGSVFARHNVISNIKYSTEMIIVEIGEHSHIDILYLDENFHGPEAFVLKTPHGVFVDQGAEQN